MAEVDGVERPRARRGRRLSVLLTAFASVLGTAAVVVAPSTSRAAPTPPESAVFSPLTASTFSDRVRLFDDIHAAATAVAVDGARVFAVQPESDGGVVTTAIHEIDPVAAVVTRTVRIDIETDLFTIARLSPDGSTLWVVSVEPNEAVAIDTETLTVRTRQPAPGSPGDMAVLPGRDALLFASGTLYLAAGGELASLGMTADEVSASPDENVFYARRQSQANADRFRLDGPPTFGSPGEPVELFGNVVVAGADVSQWGSGLALDLSADDVQALRRMDVGVRWDRWDRRPESVHVYDGGFEARHASISPRALLPAVSGALPGRLVRSFVPAELLPGDRFAVPTTAGLAIVDTSIDVAPDGLYRAVEPTRLVDTRSGLGVRSGALGAGRTMSVPIAGAGPVPSAGAVAVVVNVTAVRPTQAGHLRVYPTGIERPDTSVVNFERGVAVPNLVTVPLGADGSIDVYNATGETHVLIDVMGFYSGAAGPLGGFFRAIEPERIRDTRRPLVGGGPAAAVGAGEVLTVQVGARTHADSSQIGIDDGRFLQAAVVNVTAVGATQGTFVVASAAGGERPTTSNLNVRRGQVVANQVIVPLNGSNQFELFNAAGEVHLIVDLVGVFHGDFDTSGGRFVFEEPSRILDTRADSPFEGTGAIPALSSIYFELDPEQATVSSFVFNITVIRPTERGYLSVVPRVDGAVPTTSTVNFNRRVTVANHATVMVGDRLYFFNSNGHTHVAADLVGAYLKPEFFSEFFGREEVRRASAGSSQSLRERVDAFGIADWLTLRWGTEA